MSEFKSSNSSEFIAMGGLAQGYTVIPNGIMNNIKNITSDGFTVLAKIFQFINNPDHKISIQGLATQTGLTKTRVSKAINKLIEVGYIVRIAKKNGNLTNGYIYKVYDTPQIENVENTCILRNPENEDTETKDTKLGYANKENNNNSNIKKENNDDDERETKLIKLYKPFKIEKRVTPHMQNLLKENKHISLEVFEQIFINACEDSVKKKFAYIKEFINDLNKHNVITKSDFEKYKSEFKNSKSKSNGSSSNKATKVVKTTQHNINQTYNKYSDDELEKIAKASQEGKFEDYSKNKMVQDTKNQDWKQWEENNL